MPAIVKVFLLSSGNLARHCRQVHSDNKDVRGRGTKEKYLCRRRGCDQESFTSRELFIKHLEKHAGSGGIFPCGDCNGVFSSLSNLNKHKKTQHKGDVVPAADQAKFSCDLCKADFQNEYLYQKHLR